MQLVVAHGLRNELLNACCLGKKFGTPRIIISQNKGGETGRGRRKEKICVFCVLSST